METKSILLNSRLNSIHADERKIKQPCLVSRIQKLNYCDLIKLDLLDKRKHSVIDSTV